MSLWILKDQMKIRRLEIDQIKTNFLQEDIYKILTSLCLHHLHQVTGCSNPQKTSSLNYLFVPISSKIKFVDKNDL